MPLRLLNDSKHAYSCNAICQLCCTQLIAGETKHRCWTKHAKVLIIKNTLEMKTNGEDEWRT